MNIPIEIIIFSLMFICAVGIFIGAWMRGLGHEDEARQMNDQIMLYKSRWEKAERDLNHHAVLGGMTTLEVKQIYHDLCAEVLRAHERVDKTPEYIDGLKSGLKMAILLVRPKI